MSEELKPFHPQADYVLDLLVAAGHITREKAFQARDIAIEFGPAATQSTPDAAEAGKDARAVQAAGMKAVGFVAREPQLGFAERKVGVLKEDIPAGTILYAALPPPGAPAAPLGGGER